MPIRLADTQQLFCLYAHISRGRVPVYWPGKQGRGMVLWWVMEGPVSRCE